MKKILIANRGEIAIRIMKAAKSLNIKSVAIYSDEDCNSAHKFIADENYSLGKGSLEETYLNISSIINIAKLSNCQAIHPGYGFLAENHEFVKKCNKENITFIGPSGNIIKRMGNKIIARDFVKKLGVNIIAGIEGSVNEILKNKTIPEFPLLVKAAAGGGGKGMRIVYKKDDLGNALLACSREAKNYFGDGTVFVEKYLVNPRHIEVQILGDKFGNNIHLFERECSIQRRYQKIIEESPAIVLNQATRIKICNDAIKIAKASNYDSVGTIEFLLDENGQYYFLEMNTRIQVEHPVTETVTGIDIVKAQIKVADGQELEFRQEDITQKKSAIECRIYAEDSENSFLPSPGKIHFYKEPQNEFTRIDSSLTEANEIKSSFDPMISKIITFGKNRQEAIDNMMLSLNNYHIHGIKTNIKFLKSILADSTFRQNNISTKYCENIFLPKFKIDSNTANQSDLILIAGLIYSLSENKKSKNIWETIGYWRAVSRIPVYLNNSKYTIAIIQSNLNQFSTSISNNSFNVQVKNIENNLILFSYNKTIYEFVISKNIDSKFFISYNGEVFEFERMDLLKDNYKISSNSNTNSDKVLKSSMPGKVIKIFVAEGEKIMKDDELIIIESMKMENSYFAKGDAIIDKINVKINDNITSDTELIIFKE